MQSPDNIPGPKSLPGIGTAYSVNPNNLVQSQIELGDKYGEIFLHDLPQQPPLYIVSSHRLTHELCDQKRFHKAIHPSLEAIRNFAGNGLFTSYFDEPEWGNAHRILMPAFNPTALKGMYSGMTDIAEQLMLKWTRTRDDEPVDIPGDCTRLTLDTIALCSFSYRFNSFYSEELHPFVSAMVNGLKDSGKRSHLPGWMNTLNVRGTRRYWRDIKTMEETVDALIAERKDHPTPSGNKDVLDVMLNAKDPKTGEKLSDENLRYQLITFLIAGHETTSGLLSFVVYELIRHPHVADKARAIVDEVLGGRFPEYDDLKDLGYLDQILREALRLYPTAPAFGVNPYEETVLGADEKHDGIRVTPEDTLLIMLGRMHRDPEVWDEPEEFRPERFDFENAKKIPQHAWKPFGNGQRSCLGRAFALQEATMVLALMLQHFEFEFYDPHYKLDVIDGLTSKPKDLFVKVKNRPGHLFTGKTARDHEASDLSSDTGKAPVAKAEPNGHKIQIAVGSNAGTCFIFAKKLETFALQQGYEVEISDLDDATDNLQTADPVIVLTSSYEGLPPDNAARFVEWLTTQNPDLAGVRFAVCGSGNSEWAGTFQRIPTLVDEEMAAHGATRLTERGLTDVRNDHIGQFEEWAEELWDAISAELNVEHSDVSTPALTLEEAADRSAHLNAAQPRGLNEDYLVGEVVETALLSASEDNGPIRKKMHLEIQLPEGADFSTGDYLEVLPRNSRKQVDRALSTFGLLGDSRVVVRTEHPFLPVGSPLTYREILSDYVELSTVPSRKAVEQLAAECPCPPEKAQLELLAGEAYQDEVQNKRLSLLDLVETFPSARPDFAVFLDSLLPITPRRYSISSSARLAASRPAITFSVIDEPAWSGRGNFNGMTTTYLAGLQRGDRIQVRVVGGNPRFRLDETPTAPVLLIGAGTGIAPLRAFLQELATKKSKAGAATPNDEPEALLFYGCHGRNSDYLYAEELQRWEDQNVVSVRPAFSRHPERGVDGNEIKYVQHKLWDDRREVMELCRRGAKVLVCGDAERLAPGVRDTFVEMVAEDQSLGRPEAERYVDSMQREKFSYVADVFE